MTRRRSRPGARRLLAAVAALALSACAGAPERAMVAPRGARGEPQDGRDRRRARRRPRRRGGAPKPEAAAPAPAETAPARTIATQPVFRPRPPELLARIEGPDLEALPFVVHDVTVVVSGHRARVVFDMVFANPSNRTLAGTLMIGLPDRASPCYLATFDGRGADSGAAEALLAPVPPGPEALLAQPIATQARWAGVDWGAERAARVVEPVKGREVYEAVTRRRVDPALGEWAGSGTYSARIYPLAPGASSAWSLPTTRPCRLRVGASCCLCPSRRPGRVCGALPSTRSAGSSCGRSSPMAGSRSPPSRPAASASGALPST